MGTASGIPARPDPSRWRRHDDDGISQEAHRLINKHGLRLPAVLEFADYYSLKSGIDFNLAPAQDFEGALLGQTLAKAMFPKPAFAPYLGKFDKAVDAFDYAASDGIIDTCLRDNILVGWAGMSAYDLWKRYAERLEGLNAALFRAARDALVLHRFILKFAELGNYRRGRWRMAGDEQDRVPTTVGMSNQYLDKAAVAEITYRADAIRDWMQPVRYSPYPRNMDTSREAFGHEKDGIFAAEGEVHVHVGCPIPPREYVKIGILSLQGQERREIVERYGCVGTIEW